MPAWLCEYPKKAMNSTCYVGELYGLLISSIKFFFLRKTVHFHCRGPRKSVISAPYWLPLAMSAANTEAPLGNFLQVSWTSAIAMKQASYINEGHWQFLNKGTMYVPWERLRVPCRCCCVLWTWGWHSPPSNHFQARSWQVFWTKPWGGKQHLLCGSSFWMMGWALITATKVMVFTPFSAISHTDFK